ncbi:MAG: gamma-glutamyltransferase, partial [Calditrichaeota bacterium]|nr:gamma-glutamyltransferase [Calditrichota bacterium]
ELAENGFVLSYNLVRDFQYLAPQFADYPGSVKKFSKPDGSFYEMDEIWQQPDLAATLRRIAEKGRDGFYKGKTAEIFETEMKANGGLITRADLAAYQA